MAWMVEEFGASHEGVAGAVLADGSEPKPVVLDVGSGTNVYRTTEWWAYTGRWGRPKAAGYRAACACGWRGPAHPLDEECLREGREELDEADVSPAYEDWLGHIDTVGRQTVPLPDEVTDALDRLESRLARLTDQAPVAALRAVDALERLVRDAGRRAACTAEADDLSPEALGKGLGISAEAARSRLVRYRFRP